MPIYGFQFQVSGVTLSGASGAFDMISFNEANGSVFGASLSGTSLAAGEGSLVTLSFDPALDGSIISIADVIIGGQGGTNIVVTSSPSDSTIPACANNDGDLSCNVADEWPDCSDDGSNPFDDCNECNGGNAEKDCNEDCFGSAFVDGCDVCSEGNTGHSAESDIDCNGDCFVSASDDRCDE